MSKGCNSKLGLNSLYAHLHVHAWKDYWHLFLPDYLCSSPIIL